MSSRVPRSKSRGEGMHDTSPEAVARLRQKIAARRARRGRWLAAAALLAGVVLFWLLVWLALR